MVSWIVSENINEPGLATQVQMLNTTRGVRINHFHPWSSFILLHSFIQALFIKPRPLPGTGDMVVKNHMVCAPVKVGEEQQHTHPQMYNHGCNTCFQRDKPDGENDMEHDFRRNGQSRALRRGGILADGLKDANELTK